MSQQLQSFFFMQTYVNVTTHVTSFLKNVSQWFTKCMKKLLS